MKQLIWGISYPIFRQTHMWKPSLGFFFDEIETRLGSTALRLSPSSPAVQCVPDPPERIHLSPALLQAPPG